MSATIVKPNRLVAVLCLLAIIISGCGKREETSSTMGQIGSGKASIETTSSTADQATAPASTILNQRTYEQSVALDVDNDEVSPLFMQVKQQCQALQGQCLLLSAYLENGPDASARITMKILKPQALNMVAGLAKRYRITSDTLKSDDLAQPIQQDQARLTAVQLQIRQLKALLTQPDLSHDWRDDYTKQLAKLESELLSLQQDQSKQRLELDSQILHLELGAQAIRQQEQPIRSALTDAGYKLGQTIAIIISAVAYTIPVLVTLLLLWLAGRVLVTRIRHWLSHRATVQPAPQQDQPAP